ncbi:hypothetical protein MBLNU457_3587t1 [Dothideomycetes sp. NU457]
MSPLPITGPIPEDSIVETDDHTEDMIKKIAGPPLDSSFVKSQPPRLPRRESLLTRQLNGSEGDSHTDDDARSGSRQMRRGFSASSNPSVASTAELTDDNEITSPGTRNSSASPPFPISRLNTMIPVMDKPISEEPVIADHHDEPESTPEKAETNVQAELGRRRCITFACGKKETAPPKEVTAAPAEPEKNVQQTEPQRKTCLTFACPTKTNPPTKTNTPANPPGVPEIRKPKSSRHISPAVLHRSPRSPRMHIRHAHRGSDSTIKNESPSSVRNKPAALKHRKYSNDQDEAQAEAQRFHEFGTSAAVEEDWTKESTCYRNRLTVRDTLQKENVIRQMGEEVEEEAIDDDEDDENDDEEELLDELDDDDDDDGEDDIEEEDEEVDADGDDDLEIEEDAVSDAGFDTDDECGFAGSDAESENSDFEWWAPGRSTAATSTEHFDNIRTAHHRTLSDSSLESSREANGLSRKKELKAKRKTQALNINRPVTPELPDSTDFVCGTLDEDRPLEQAYLQSKEQKKAALHKITPQDIDPTFPTSDPEMDEEDDEEEEEDENAVDEDEESLFMHGKIDLNEERGRRQRTDSTANKKKSPPRSPRRLHSPPPPAKKAVHRSPPPPTKKPVHRSPPPPSKKQVHRSPPPLQRTNTQRHRSPAPPKRLFGTSPKRTHSPPPSHRLTSPPNSAERTPTKSITIAPGVLASRPQPTRTASLPRVSTATRLQRLAADHDDNDQPYDVRTRGAIDIVKGLEKKRLRRKEKLYQKHCQKKIKEGEKKPKPGKGAQRMREVGLELAAYRGKNVEHMLSY